MKKLLSICMLCVLLLCGCETEVEEENNDKSTSMFVELEETRFWTVVYHKDTKVMYAVSFGTNNRGVFTLLVNADGTPMLWEEGDE